MFDSNVLLYIVSYDLTKNERCVVSSSEKSFTFLSKKIEDYHVDVNQPLSELFENHVDLAFGWITPKLVDVKKIDNSINILYCCTIPPGTELKNAYYISTNLCIINALARKAMAYV